MPSLFGWPGASGRRAGRRAAGYAAPSPSPLSPWPGTTPARSSGSGGASICRAPPSAASLSAATCTASPPRSSPSPSPPPWAWARGAGTSPRGPGAAPPDADTRIAAPIAAACASKPSMVGSCSRDTGRCSAASDPGRDAARGWGPPAASIRRRWISACAAASLSWRESTWFRSSPSMACCLSPPPPGSARWPAAPVPAAPALSPPYTWRPAWATDLRSRRSSFTSLMSATFSCIMRALSWRCSSMFLLSLRLRLSTDFSRYSLWRAYSA
mmetsp:Transcript_17518/g.50860  ORF Transcript_17518/g.50860 Transcript_17518/m.50860 type:complete len:270 (+) Transcript_17518:105-914(+)